MIIDQYSTNHVYLHRFCICVWNVFRVLNAFDFQTDFIIAQSSKQALFHGFDQRFWKHELQMKLHPPNAHRSQIKIFETRQTQNVNFRFMPNAFQILKPIQRSSKHVWVFPNTGTKALMPKTKCVWHMKINVICTVSNILILVSQQYMHITQHVTVLAVLQ